MKAQKVINLLEESQENELEYQIRKFYIMNDQNNGQYQENTTIKYNTEVIKSLLCDYQNAFILLTCDMVVVNGDNNISVAFKLF